MPRKARLNVPGAIYHVMGRSLPHLDLFADDADRERFLSLITLAYIAAKEYRAPLHAVAEYLWVGRTGASSLSRQGRDIVKRKKIVI